MTDCLTEDAILPTVRPISLVLLVLMISLLFVPASRAELTASVDATEMTTGQSLRLVVTSTLQDSNEKPDFSALNLDFNVYMSSEQTNVQTINNEMTRSRSWYLELVPKSEGIAEIPVFELGGETTEAIQITVNPPREHKPGEHKGDYYMEVEVDKATAYVQSQVIYTLRIYSVQNFLDGSLSEVKAEGVQVQELGEPRNYREQILGRTYQVLEKKFALFPQRSGEITIPGVVLQASVPRDGARNRGFFTPSQNIRRQSEQVTVSVLPRPESSGSDWWLPATGVQISSHWEGNQSTLRVGDSVTRNIMLLASGVSSTQLPALPVQQSDEYKVYASQPKLNEQITPQGLNAVRQEKWAIVALQAGTFKLPEIRVPWFNTNTGKSELALLPAQTLTVLPAENAQGQNFSPAANPRQSANASTAQVGVESPSAAMTARLAGQSQQTTRWKWTAVILGALWLLTGAALVRLMLMRRHDSAAAAASSQRKQLKSPSITPVKKALASGDVRTSTEALLQWAQQKWPVEPPRTLMALGERFTSVELKDQLGRLDSLLYARRQDIQSPEHSANPPDIEVLTQLQREFPQAVAQLPAKFEGRTESTLPGL